MKISFITSGTGFGTYHVVEQRRLRLEYTMYYGRIERFRLVASLQNLLLVYHNFKKICRAYTCAMFFKK